MPVLSDEDFQNYGAPKNVLSDADFENYGAPPQPQADPQLTALARQAAARRALAQGAPDQPAGGYDAGSAPQGAWPAPATGGQLASEWGQAAQGAAKAVPATMTGFPGDIEGAGRTLARNGLNLPVSDSTFLPTSGEGGMVGPRGLNLINPPSTPDEKAGFTMAQTLMSLRGLPGGPETAAPAGGAAVRPLSAAGQADRSALQDALRAKTVSGIASKVSKLQGDDDFMARRTPAEKATLDALGNTEPREDITFPRLAAAEALGHSVGLPFAGTGVVGTYAAARRYMQMRGMRTQGRSVLDSITNNDAGPAAPTPGPGPTGPKVAQPAQPWGSEPPQFTPEPDTTPEQIKDAGDLMAARQANAKLQAAQEAASQSATAAQADDATNLMAARKANASVLTPQIEALLRRMPPAANNTPAPQGAIFQALQAQKEARAQRFLPPTLRAWLASKGISADQ